MIQIQTLLTQIAEYSLSYNPVILMALSTLAALVSYFVGTRAAEPLLLRPVAARVFEDSGLGLAGASLYLAMTDPTLSAPLLPLGALSAAIWVTIARSGVTRGADPCLFLAQKLEAEMDRHNRFANAASEYAKIALGLNDIATTVGDASSDVTRALCLAEEKFWASRWGFRKKTKRSVRTIARYERALSRLNSRKEAVLDVDEVCNKAREFLA